MRSKLQRLGVGVCPAVVCAAAVLMAGLILLLPLRAHRFAHWPGAPINRGVFPASQIAHAGSAPAESFTASQRTGGAAADKAGHVAQGFPLPRRDGAHFNPAASPNPESRIPNPVYGSAAQPRLAEAYGKLPLSFEINKGQTDSRVRFLSRGGGYSLFLTGNEAVLSLRKSNSNGKRQKANGVAQGSHSNPAVLPGLFDGPGAHQNEAAFPAFFRTPTAEFTDSAPANDCGGKDLEKPQGLKGEPCATRTTDALLRMKLVGANPNPKIVGVDELPGKSNYFIGNDPKKWRTNVPNYAKVKYANVYPGVDLVYYGNQGQLEYDLVVRPGADPNSIQLAIASFEQEGRQSAIVNRKSPITEGQSAIDNRKSSIRAPLHVNATGDLVVGTDGGELIFHKPVVYQPQESRQWSVVSRQLHSTTDKGQRTKDGGKDYVDGRYVVRNDQSVAFQVVSYDPAKPLVIDPVLAYSTYLGGNGSDVGLSITVDASGNAYVLGYTNSSNFPTTPGAFQTTPGDGFVSKLNAAGSALVYSTYLGGSSFGSVASTTGIVLDAAGNAYVIGGAGTDFPTTPGAFQTTCGGEVDAFVSKLNAAGSALLYSTCLGGSGDDFASGVAIDSSGNAYVTGYTYSSDFPTTPGAFQITFGGGLADAFVSKLNAAGSALAYSTYLGGIDFDQGVGVAVDASGNAYVAGETFSSDFPTTPGAFQKTAPGNGDAFVSKLNAAGSALLSSTYLGGSGIDGGASIAIDSSGNAYVTGWTASSNFPTTSGAFQTIYGGGQDAFVTKLNAGGSALLYSAYLGGSDIDFGSGIAVDTLGNAYVTGHTLSSNFPTTAGAFQTTYGGGEDAFVSKLNAAGSALVYSTYLGGSGGDGGSGIAVDAFGNAYVTGGTASSNFPTTPGAFQTRGSSFGDAFAAKISTGVGAPLVTLTPARVPFLVLRTVGTTSLPHTVKLTNVGSAELDITGITLTGSDPGDFAQSNNCPPTIASGGSCLITVTFTPTTQGVRTASVSIKDNAPGSPQTVPLSGRGTFLEWVPRQIYMGAQKVGTSSAARTVTLTNAGTAPIALFSIGIAGVNPRDFSETNDCGSSLKAGASCTIQVTFTPAAVGSRLGHVAIRDSAFGGTHWVGLLGKGT
jgi:hypothetical protein